MVKTTIKSSNKTTLPEIQKTTFDFNHSVRAKYFKLDTDKNNGIIENNNNKKN